MADKIQNAYETSKNIYDDVLTQRNIFSKLYIYVNLFSLSIHKSANAGISRIYGLFLTFQ